MSLLSERLCASTHRTWPAEDGQDREEGGIKKSRAGNSLWQQHGTQLKSYLNRMKRPGVSDSSRDEREELAEREDFEMNRQSAERYQKTNSQMSPGCCASHCVGDSDPSAIIFPTYIPEN